MRERGGIREGRDLWEEGRGIYVRDIRVRRDFWEEGREGFI